jgi:hypothetical protein
MQIGDRSAAHNAYYYADPEPCHSPVIMYHQGIYEENYQNESYYMESYEQKIASPKQFWMQLEDTEMDRVFNEPKQPERVSVPPCARISSARASEPQVEEEPFSRQFMQLHQMGFGDDVKNESLLNKYGGDVEKVVQELVGPTDTTIKSVHPKQYKQFKLTYDYCGDNKYEINIMDANDRIVNTAHMLLFFRIKLMHQRITELIITKEELHVHPTYAVSSGSGPLLGVCTQRFKISQNRKFNYRLSNGTVLKMTGCFGRDFEIKRNGSVVATVHPRGEGHIEIFVRPKLTKDEHVLAMVLIMLERQLTKNLS